MAKNRREFLKAGSKVLPVIAGLGLAAVIPGPSYAAAKPAQACACGGGCGSSCSSGCGSSCSSGCGSSCSSGCGSACSSGCGNTCTSSES